MQIKIKKWDDYHVCLLITNNASKIPPFHFKNPAKNSLVYNGCDFWKFLP